MKVYPYYQLLLPCVILFVNNQVASGSSYAVSSLIGFGSEALYLRYCSTDFGRAPNLSVEDVEQKLEICKNILNSPFGNFHLRPKNGIVHSRSLHRPGNSSEHTDPVRNPYIARNITVHGHTVTEFVFACSAEHGLPEDTEYFVSREYACRWPTSSARFVFEYNNKKEIVVLAIVEAPVYMFSLGASEKEEISNASVKSLSGFSRPLCNLGPNERMRLCMLMSGKYGIFHDVPTYSPYEENIVPECEEKKLSIGPEYPEFTDWVLRCRRRFREDSGKQDFCISKINIEDDRRYLFSKLIADDEAVANGNFHRAEVLGYFYYLK